jgi:hAT family C-terminal dimerisation region
LNLLKAINKIFTIVNCLEPVKLAVDALCRRDATLLSSDTTICFMMDNLGDSALAVELKYALAERINQRRTQISSLLQYLHIDDQRFEHVHLLLEFEKLTKLTLAKLIVKLIERLSGSDVIAETTDPTDKDIETETPEVFSQTLCERLHMAIEHENQSEKKKVGSKNLLKDIKTEITIFEQQGIRGPNLTKCYIYLKTVPPTSVESERCFSASGSIVTKLRSCLNDETIDA